MTRIIGFLLLLTVVYFGFHAYILGHVMIFLDGQDWRWVYYTLYAVLVVWGLIARLLDNRALPRWSDPLVIIGSLALPWIFYAGMYFFLYDILYIVCNQFFVDTWLFTPFAKFFSFVFLHFFVAAWFFCGYRSARTPKVVPYSIDISHDKGVERKKVITIALLTDIHIGTINNGRYLDKIIDRVLAAKPDLILMGGDVFDGRMDIVSDRSLHLPLQRLSAPLGVYGAYGNHEYYGDAHLVEQYMRDVGVVMLRDEGCIVGDFYLIGRDDRSVLATLGRQRLSTKALVKGNTKNLPIILIDHQPSHLEQSSNNGVSLQLSGHTHNGQLWPMGILVSLLFEKNKGYHRKQNTHYVVSPGVGTWGFPIKTSAQSEISLISLTYDTLSGEK